MSLDEIPAAVKNAVIATEDRNFYEHDGLNPIGIARAFYQNVKGGSVSQGGSTITQQYVKNAFELSTERAVSRKAKEAILSIKLEQQMSKDEILEGYLNTIYFGRGLRRGRRQPAYFGVDIRTINESQASLLAGLIRAPATADPTNTPRKPPAGATPPWSPCARRATSTPSCSSTSTPSRSTGRGSGPTPRSRSPRSAGAAARTPPTTWAPTTSQFIREEVKRIDPVLFTDNEIDRGGLRIYTSLNYDMQLAAWSTVVSTLDSPEDPEAALVAVDDQGLIRAMVGSRNPFRPAPTRTTTPSPAARPARRSRRSCWPRPSARATPSSPGSTPRAGWSSRSGPTPTAAPGRSATTPRAMAATSTSCRHRRGRRTPPTPSLVLALGTERVDADGDGVPGGQRRRRRGRAGGANGPRGTEGIPEDRRVPSMVLGSAEATPLEMAGVYSTFANRGMYKRPQIVTRIEQVDQDGKNTLLWEYAPADPDSPRARPTSSTTPSRPSSTRAARPRAPTSASRPPARPAPPRRTERGSPASCPSSPRWCGWATPTPATAAAGTTPIRSSTALHGP